MKKILNLLFLILFFYTHISCHGEESSKKIALLFLTIGDLNHSELWHFLLNKNLNKFNIYIHNKEKVTHPFFCDFCLEKTVSTTWSNHVYAWQKLLRKALKNPQNYKFVFLSDSCIPLRPLNTIYKKLTKNNFCYMNYWQSYWKEGSNRIINELPESYRKINSEWVILNRDFARLISHDHTIIRLCDSYSHSSESYPSTLFSFFGCLDTGFIINKPTTYVDFERGKNSHPYCFKHATKKNVEAIKKAKKSGCLFIRKVSKSFPEDVLKEIIFSPL